MDLHGRERVISTDQMKRCQSDGKDRTTDAQSTEFEEFIAHKIVIGQWKKWLWVKYKDD